MNRTPRRTSFRKLPLASLAGAMASLLIAGPVSAQLVLPEGLDSPLRPYYVQVSQTLSYDSNLFRAQRDEDSDVISSTALTGGFDQQIGRQRVFGNAGVSGNVYQDNDQLNGLGYNLMLGLAWEAGSRLNGTARVRASQNQASFADYGSFSADRTGKNREQANVLDLSAQYGRGVVGLEALANHTDISYSDGGFSSRDRKSSTVGGGLRFRPGGPWSFGLTARFTEGEYPDTVDLNTGETVPDDYDRRDIDLTAQYQATGRSVLSARISHTDEEHDLVTARDFNGITGALNWVYAATGKTTVTTSLSRNTGTGTGSRFLPDEFLAPSDPLAPAPTQTGTVSYLTDARRSDSLNVSANWEATAKIVVNASVGYSRDRYDTRFVEGADDDSDSTGNTKSLRLAASYAISRAWSLGCGLAYYSRDTEISTSTGSFGYDATTAYCSAALRLQ
ncbi:hypothetical protein [Methylibium sp.]|uniref:hypothetical protein n=1 Tax=Methylibium sp. TaxID=2067992 RepID=UPI0018564F26|nr:hypothetical protein [Methylibium sp.]MBA3588018.1 hypothetical protein [Methylibium sp.]